MVTYTLRTPLSLAVLCYITCSLSYTMFLLRFPMMNPCFFARGLSKDEGNIYPEKEKMYIMKKSADSKRRIFLPTAHTKEDSMSQTLLEMAKDLVLAQIQAKTLPPEDMHTALQQTYASLKALQA